MLADGDGHVIIGAMVFSARAGVMLSLDHGLETGVIVTWAAGFS
jgi:hypothetical protein